MSVEFLYLSCEEVKKAAPSYEETIQAIENVMRAEYAGKVVMPIKTNLSFPERKGGFLNSLPAYVMDLDVAGIKWVSGFEGAKEQGLPYIMGIIILNDAHTGAPIAIMDGTFLTEMRTACVSAVAAKYLAKKNSTSLGIIGCGAIGRAHLAAMSTLFELSEILCYDIQDMALNSLIQHCQEKIPANLFHPVDSPAKVLSRAEIICTCTVPSSPFLRYDELAAGTFVSSVEGRQVWLDDEYVKFDKICVDKWSSLKEGAHLRKVLEKGLLSDKHIYCELPQLSAGSIIGRKTDEERIIFLSRGLGMEDVVLAKLVYENAKKSACGQFLTLI